MKNTFLIFIVAAVLLPIYGFADSSLEEIFKKKLAYTLEFDRGEAEIYLCEEFGIKAPPVAPGKEEEMGKEILENAKKLADEKFPESMKDEVKLEAKKKFKVTEKGDRITVPVKVGQGFDEHTGTYMGTFGEKIIVGSREIRIDDLPPDVVEQFDVKKIREKRALHFKNNYTLPRLKYTEEMVKKLQEEMAEKKMAYDKFQETLAEKEKTFVREQKLIAIKRAVPIFIAEQEKMINEEKDSKKRLELYRKLADDIIISVKGLGLDLDDTSDTKIDEILKTIAEYAKIKNEIIPTPEKKIDDK